MPKKSDKESSVTALWGKTIKALDMYIFKIQDECLSEICRVINDLVLDFVEDANLISTHDEKLFEYYRDIIGYYYKALDIYEKNKEFLSDKMIIKIMDGIVMVVSSQIKQFEELQKSSFDSSTVNNAENPIEQEKFNILNEIIKDVDKQLNSFNNRENEKQWLLNKKEMRKLFMSFKEEHSFEGYVLMSGNVFEKTMNLLGGYIFNVYEKAIMSCSSRINNLQQRKVAGLYFDLLKYETENLTSIIKIQIEALEFQIRQRLVSKSEEQSVQQVLTVFREAYQFLGKDINELMNHFKNIGSNTHKRYLLSQKDFFRLFKVEKKKAYTNFIKQKGVMPYEDEELLIDWIMANKDFNSSFNTFIINETLRIIEVDEQTKNTAITNLFKSNELLTLSNDIKPILYRLIKYYNDNRNFIENEIVFPIIKGIQETILIKYESFEENTKIFEEEINIEADNLNKTLAPVTESDIDFIISESKEHWIDLLTDGADEHMNYKPDIFFPKIYPVDEAGELKLHRSKKVEGIGKRLEAKMNDYLKNRLLFEISTFEEIVNYSVLRLKNSEGKVIADYVKEFDEATRKLINLLAIYNIKTIAPLRGDWFDGREHEVLMAEKDENLAKGQVIKLMNSGYKYGDNVVLRANIIAAK